MGLPHYGDARMQHSQSRQPALPGVTTVVALRAVPASTNEVFPTSPTQNSGNKDSRKKTRHYLVKRRSCDVTSTAEPLQLDATPQGNYQDPTSRRCDACPPQMLPQLQHSISAACLLRHHLLWRTTGWTLPLRQMLCRGTARKRMAKC